jgi:hypothetical protein
VEFTGANLVAVAARRLGQVFVRADLFNRDDDFRG